MANRGEVTLFIIDLQFIAINMKIHSTRIHGFGQSGPSSEASALSIRKLIESKHLTVVRVRVRGRLWLRLGQFHNELLGNIQRIYSISNISIEYDRKTFRNLWLQTIDVNYIVCDSSYYMYIKTRGRQGGGIAKIPPLRSKISKIPPPPEFFRRPPPPSGLAKRGRFLPENGQFSRKFGHFVGNFR